MQTKEELQKQIKTLSDYIKNMEVRIKKLEQENQFVEALNMNLMQQGAKNEQKG